MDVNDFLSRLEKVRATGRDRWVACCPAHQDRSPSLTVRVVDDGRILVHCFAGCGAADVLGSVGLDFADLFPDQPLYHRGKRLKQTFGAVDALRALSREAGVVALLAADLASGKPVDAQRAILAASRISDAVEYVNAAR